ncbi:hypothetical protein B0H10DRAFT_213178 [Mycena sp. CBHHK59/15]|nr:hypothetical protein B0H10DRAFT_213178 [Mycena sp. CBHHK59/15]
MSTSSKVFLQFILIQCQLEASARAQIYVLHGRREPSMALSVELCTSIAQPAARQPCAWPHPAAARRGKSPPIPIRVQLRPPSDPRLACDADSGPKKRRKIQVLGTALLPPERLPARRHQLP